MFEKYDLTFDNDGFKRTIKDLYRDYDYKIDDDFLGDDITWDHNSDMMDYFKEMLYKSTKMEPKETPEEKRMKARQAKIDDLLK